jgi:transposase
MNAMSGADGARLESFRQLKNDIRGSEKHLIVGIDVAKEKHNAFFGTARGKTLIRNLTFDNSLKGFETLLAMTDRVKIQHSLSAAVFGIEPTANYHKPLAEHLIKCACMVVLLSGAAVKHNRQLLDGRWDKHDVKDAANIADLIAQGKFQFYEYPLMPLRDVRNLVTLKRRLKRREHAISVCIRNNLIAQYFPELDRHYGPQETLEVVRKCLGPAAIAGMEHADFRDAVAPKRMTVARDRRIKAIWQDATMSIGCAMGEGAEYEAQVMVESLKHVRREIEGVEAKLEEACLKFPEYACLLSIPGFGPDVSSKVLGAIGNPNRFENARQVLKMAGLDLCANRSGNTSSSAVPVISKQGKADLRYALYQAAQMVSLKNKEFVAYFTAKLEGRAREKGICTKMRVKLAAKLLVIAWTLMKKRECFDPKYIRGKARQTAA